MKPGLLSYNTKLQFYGVKGDIQKQNEILRDLRKVYKPDVYTLGSILSGCIVAKDFIMAKKWYNILISEGVIPSQVIVELLLDAAESSGSEADICWARGEFQRLGILRTHVTTAELARDNSRALMFKNGSGNLPD